MVTTQRDSWYSGRIGLGTPSDGVAQARYFEAPALSSVEQDALMNNNAIASRIASLEPEDCTRMGVVIHCEQAADIEREADRVGLLAAVRAGKTYARAYGGAVIIALTRDSARLPDGRTDYSAPLLVDTIESVDGFLVLDRWDVTAMDWRYDPRSPVGIVPTRYMVSPMYGLPTADVHPSRVVPLIGILAPPRVRVQRYSYWGPSVFDRCYEDLRNYQVGGEFVGRMLVQSSVSVLQSKYLSDAILSGNADIAKARIEALQESMSALNMMSIDKDHESFTFAGRPITGVGDAMTASKERLIAATGVPMSLLFGETRGGLNTGEASAEVRAWYAHCASAQEAEYRHPIAWCLDLILRAKSGPTGGVVPPDWAFEFRPLWEPDEMTRATTRKTNAEARAIDIQSGIITTDEARACDPTLPETYPDLDISAPAASDGPVSSLLGGASLLGGMMATGGPGAAGGGDLGDDVPVTDDLPPDGEGLVSLREAAEAVGVSRGTIKRWAKNGDVRAWKPGSTYRVILSECRAAMGGARVQPFAPEADA